jgi:hypothetical protein
MKLQVILGFVLQKPVDLVQVVIEWDVVEESNEGEK